MSTEASAVRRLAERPLPVPVLDEAKLEAVVAIIKARYPGNPHDSVRRCVALFYEALAGLFSERDAGTYPDPQAFCFGLETLARATVVVARRRGSDVHAIDLLEIRAILDALVRGGVLTVLPAADTHAHSDAWGATLAFAQIARVTVS